MSDATPDEDKAAPKIDFDRAEFAEPASAELACSLCQRSITTEYWQLLGKILCDGCRRLAENTAVKARGGVALGKAALLGGGVALGCGIGYAIFVGLTNIQFALVTIGIGWAVGTTIQKVTRGFGSRRHQVLAVALTYFASTMGYFPAVIKALKSHAESSETTPSSAPSSAPAPSSPSSPSTASPADLPPAEKPAPAKPADAAPPSLLLSLIVVTAFSLFFTLTAPLFEITSGFSGILGALIIFFGLRTAWRVSQGVGAAITGPHQVAANDKP